MSSVHHTEGPEKCIDGITDGPDGHPGDLCHTNPGEQFPWFAMDFGKDFRVSAEKVLLYNRVNSSSDATRTRNVEIRLSDELPTSTTTIFAGGALLGTFAGPGTSGQVIEIESAPGWSMKTGRYLIVQMDNDNEPLNLKEVTAFGVDHQGKKKMRAKFFDRYELCKHTEYLCLSRNSYNSYMSLNRLRHLGLSTLGISFKKFLVKCLRLLLVTILVSSLSLVSRCLPCLGCCEVLMKSKGVG